jgi:hypothetical protein
MKKVIPAVLAFAILVVALTIAIQKFLRKAPATQVANRLVELINAADYSGVESLFNKEMSQGLPLEKATAFFKGLTEQVGKVQKLDEPKRNAGWTVFPVHCERGMLNMSLVLDDENKIAGLNFKPAGR